MSDNTKIQWAKASWNSVTGCSPVSEGCTNCYAKRIANRLKGRFGYPKDDPFKVTFHPDRLYQPLKWKKPRRIFVCSMGDIFHGNLRHYSGKDLPPWEVIFCIYATMMKATQHTYIILTKRPENMLEFYNEWIRASDLLSHVWVGCTAENQKRYDERWSIAQQIPAAKLFVSGEPLLGPIDFSGFARKPDWVICGAETGPGARPMDPYWARNLRDQCKAANVPFFMKAMSGKEPIPSDLQMWYEKLKFARKVKGLSIRSVSEMVNVSNPYICEIENGKINDPSFFKMAKLLKLYNLSFEDMIGEE